MDTLMQAPQTQAMTKAGLAAGTTTTLTQTLAGGATSNIVTIRGKMYSVTALSNTATPTADWATGVAFKPVLANQGCVFMVGFSAAGGLKAIQGQIAALDVNGNFITGPNFGALGPAGSGRAPAAKRLLPDRLSRGPGRRDRQQHRWLGIRHQQHVGRYRDYLHVPGRVRHH